MIIIDENYAVETDSFGNYSLFCRKTTKKGKTAGEERKEYVGHYRNIKNALMSYVRDRFNTETQDLEIPLADAIARLEAIENDAIAKFRF